MANSFQIFVKRQIFLIIFFHQYVHQYKILQPFLHKANARITSFHVAREDILLITKTLDSSKAHGWYNKSIKRIKISGESITVPLNIIFEQSLKEKKLPEVWKKANIVPVHIKEDKSLIKTFRIVSLIRSFSKIYERVI